MNILYFKVNLELQLTSYKVDCKPQENRKTGENMTLSRALCGKREE